MGAVREPRATSVTSLTAFHGAIAMLVFCVLLFAEESGVPLPLVPGDIVLVVAGVLIRSGALSPWPFIPFAVVAGTAGAMVGFGWARLLGRRGLQALARRLRFAKGLERIEGRLHNTGPRGVFVARLLIPGMRVNTTLIAGAMEVPRRAFVSGLIPAMVIWVPAMTGLGVVAGIPIEHAFAAIDNLALQGGELLVVGVAGYLAARHAPSRSGGHSAAPPAPTRQRVVLALALDLATVASVVAGFEVIVGELLHVRHIDDLLYVTATVGITVVAYVVATRRGAGVTAGEALFHVSYRSRHSVAPTA
jgi:membrane protein DedA with SNARE-associated domain